MYGTPCYILIMPAEVITSFLPDLVTAVSDYVQSVSDQCLASGLITPSIYDKILESRDINKDKARTLIQAVSNSTETDKRCFELFMNILEQELPYAIRDGLLEKMRREANEKASSCTAVVPSTGDLRQIPRGELPRESVVQQTHLLGKFEEDVRQHERACGDKRSLEERLKVKTEECEKLKLECHALQSKKSVRKDVTEAKSKIAACESEIDNLKERVKEVEKLITEQDMQVKRGRNSVVLRTKDMFGRIAQESHATAWEKAREEMRMKEQETKMKEYEMNIEMQMKDKDMSMREREHKVTIQEKDVRIRELEAERKQLQTSDTSVANPSDMIISEDLNHLWEGYRVNECKGEKRKRLGLELGFTSKELDEMTVRFTRTYDDRVISLSDLLEKWVKWYPGDSRGTKTFATYSRLKSALVNAGLGDKARDLRSYDEIKERRKKEKEKKEKREREEEEMPTDIKRKSKRRKMS